MRNIVPLYSEQVAAPVANAKLVYGNGALLTSVEVVTIYWGTAWNGTKKDLPSKIDSFFDSILTSSLIDVLTEYSVQGKSIGHGSRVGSFIDSGSDPGGMQKHVADSDIQQQLQQWIKNNNVVSPNGNRLYFVYLPPGISATDPQGDDSCAEMCEYHWYISGSNPEIRYAVMPFSGCAGCLGSLAEFDALTSTSSHELCESITDPHPWTGWNDSQNGEIGDICAWQTDTVNGYTVQKEWSNTANSCRVTPPPQKIVLLRDDSGAIWVIFGGPKFHVPDVPTLERLYGGVPIDELWNGAPNQIPDIPVDRTLLREETGPSG